MSTTAPSAGVSRYHGFEVLATEYKTGHSFWMYFDIFRKSAGYRTSAMLLVARTPV